MRRRPASAKPLDLFRIVVQPLERLAQQRDVFLGNDQPGIGDGLGQGAAGAADDGDAVRHGVERGAGRGLDPARRIAGGHDDHVEPGPDLVDRGAGEGAEPGDASGDAQPLGESLELLLRGSSAHHGDGPAADELDRGAEQQVESLLVDQPADEPDREPGVGRAVHGEGQRCPELGDRAVGQRRVALAVPGVRRAR